jgi:FixJ family two-component response regulator
MPIVFVTGYGHVPVAVQAMRSGAVDFLQKPVATEKLHATIARVLEADLQHCEELLARRNLESRLSKLTAREREVCDLLALGKSTKEIASQLKINVKTVFVHRARVLEKMQVDNLVALSSLLRDF